VTYCLLKTIDPGHSGLTILTWITECCYLIGAICIHVRMKFRLSHKNMTNLYRHLSKLQHFFKSLPKVSNIIDKY
jgi:hypothetical protein